MDRTSAGIFVDQVKGNFERKMGDALAKVRDRAARELQRNDVKFIPSMIYFDHHEEQNIVT